MAFQSDDTATLFDTNTIFYTNSDGNIALGSDDYGSMETCYGYTSSGDLESFAYAGKIEAKFVIPRANLTGTMYSGKLRLGQIFNGSGEGAGQLSIGALIRGANTVEGMKPGFNIKSSIVNDYILTHTLKNGADTITDYIRDVELGSEVVDYVVLQSPAVNITTGADMTYSMICESRINAAVLPTVNNLLLYRTFQAISHHKQKKEIDYPYAPVEEGFLESTMPPKNYKELYNFENKLNHQAQVTGVNRVADVGQEEDQPISLQATLSEDFDIPDPKMKRRATTKYKDDKSLSESDDEEEKSKGLKLITRRQGAIIAAFHAYKRDFESLGIKMPLQFWGKALPALAHAGFGLIKNFIDDPQFVDKVGNVVSAVGRAMKQKGPKKREALQKAAVQNSGIFAPKIREAMGVAYDTAQHLKGLFNLGSKVRQLLTSGDKEDAAELYTKFLNQFSNMKKTPAPLNKLKKNLTRSFNKHNVRFVENARNPVIEVSNANESQAQSE